MTDHPTNPASDTDPAQTFTDIVPLASGYDTVMEYAESTDVALSSDLAYARGIAYVAFIGEFPDTEFTKRDVTIESADFTASEGVVRLSFEATLTIPGDES